MATEKNITMKQFNGTDYDTLYPKTKVEQVEGAYSQQQILADSTKALFGLSNDAVPDDIFSMLSGSLAQILVTTAPNTEVTASLNGKTASATSDSSGLAILKVSGFGTWTVSATIGGVFVSTNCEVKVITQYKLALAPNLETANWEVIDSISNSGNAASLWSVGDKKTVNINGANYQVQIIGFNHDDKTAGGKAGITFQMVDCLGTAYVMNSSNTNVGGWKSSEMRTRMSTFLSQLPSDLQSVIKPVNKRVSIGNNTSTIETVSDKLFLLSEVELFGSASHSFAGEGSRYAYYAAGNSRVKKANGSAVDWWERSPAKDYTTDFCVVGSSRGDSNISAANNKWNYVSFAFCV